MVGVPIRDRAARHRWERVSHAGGVSALCAHGSSNMGVAPYDGEDKLLSMLPLPTLPLEHPGRSVSGARGLGRSALFGRPWDYIVKKLLGDEHTVRSPTPHQSRLITAWRLDVPADGRSLLLCNLPRAEGIMRRFLGGAAESLNDAVLSTCISVELRDSLPMVYYPKEDCHTVTTNAHLSWVGGSGGWSLCDRPGDGRFHGSLISR